MAAQCSCIKCKKIFSIYGIAIHYMRTHEKISFTRLGSFDCEYCGKNFTSKQGLNGHRQRSHIRIIDQKKFWKIGLTNKLEMAARGEISISYPHSEETKQRLSILACERLSKNSKYTKNVEYSPGVILESSFEVRTAEILDKLGVEWIKVRKGYVWNDNGKTRRYIPDFYLPAYDVFLDPKNDYLIKKDKTKIESAMSLNNIRVIVLSDAQINHENISVLLTGLEPISCANLAPQCQV